MKTVDNPKVFLIAEPVINTEEMLRYLRVVGGEAWYERLFSVRKTKWEEGGGWKSPHIPAAEGLIEFMGRLCYRSWEPGLNANVTKVREDRGEYLLNVLKSGHGSVLEHASFSFVIHNASRVMTAELNRHRAGIAISEQSMRYVRLDDLPFRLPPTLSQKSQCDMASAVKELEEEIGRIIAREITDDMSFAEKKEKTSAIRRLAPMGIGTEIGWTANVRALRHVISMRSAQGAEEEIRIFANDVAEIMQKRCPLLFGDFEPVYGPGRDPGVPAWETPHWKV